MTTICVGNTEGNKPKLLLVHGYGGSGSLYYKVLNGLSQKFYVIVIDLIGMGSSSRVEWGNNTPEQADEFFMNVFENWRINMNNLTDFVVAAHSYGGYLMGSYCAAYPQHIRKLVLLSPLGVKKPPEGYKFENLRFRRGRGPPKWALAFAKHLWGKFNPFMVLRYRCDKSARKFLNKYVSRA